MNEERPVGSLTPSKTHRPGSISDVTKAEGRRGQTTLFTFAVTLSAATSGGDYLARSGGQTTKTITIEVKGDSKKESSETFYLDLLDNNSNSQFTKTRGIGTILNDD